MKKAVSIIIRTIFIIISLAFAMYFVGSFFSGLVNIGSIAGFALSLWVFCVSLKPLHRFIRKHCRKHLITRLGYRLVNICFVAFAIYGAVVTCAMVYCASVAPAQNATAVVLGAQVKSWGPSVILQGRIDAADKYLRDNPDTIAVLSGGQGDDEPMSEAQSMYETLDAQGIDTTRLYIEDKATNTTENFKYSLEIISQNGLNEDIAVVTDGFHQLRAQIIAKQLGLKQSVGAVNADTSFKYLPVFAVREWFALPYQVLFR
jgi:uncharacterized SAM-binding protein YcdF (DUF218 family)